MFKIIWSYIQEAKICLTKKEVMMFKQSLKENKKKKRKKNKIAKKE